MIVLVLACLIFYGSHNFQKDRSILKELQARAGNGNLKYVLDNQEKNPKSGMTITLLENKEGPVIQREFQY